MICILRAREPADANRKVRPSLIWWMSASRYSGGFAAAHSGKPLAYRSTDQSGKEAMPHDRTRRQSLYE
jgi:hypothetical protein